MQFASILGKPGRFDAVKAPPHLQRICIQSTAPVDGHSSTRDNHLRGHLSGATLMGTQSSGPLDDPRLLSRLVDMCVTLNSSLEPDQVLRGILTTKAELLECEAASVLLYN